MKRKEQLLAINSLSYLAILKEIERDENIAIEQVNHVKILFPLFKH